MDTQRFMQRDAVLDAGRVRSLTAVFALQVELKGFIVVGIILLCNEWNA
ncbi:MAG: hypothetical protein ABI878_15810 [Acidobacteriota bacterium]